MSATLRIFHGMPDGTVPGHVMTEQLRPAHPEGTPCQSLFAASVPAGAVAGCCRGC